MKQFIKLTIYALFLLGSGVLIWSVIPARQMQRVHSFDPENSLFTEKINCEEVNDLVRTEFKVSYPRSIRSAESGMVQVDVEKLEIDETENKKDYGLQLCGISLEVWIDGEGLIAEPGNMIIKPYLNAKSQEIKFKIFPLDGRLISGTIWINMVFPGDKSSALERIPIFAIPFTIQVNSLLGLSGWNIRILSFSLIFMAIVLGKLLKVPIGKRR